MEFVTIGKRDCLGKSLAQIQFYLFLTGILHQFKFRSPLENLESVSLTPNYGFTLSPQPFKVIAAERPLGKPQLLSKHVLLLFTDNHFIYFSRISIRFVELHAAICSGRIFTPSSKIKFHSNLRFERLVSEACITISTCF